MIGPRSRLRLGMTTVDGGGVPRLTVWSNVRATCGCCERPLSPPCAVLGPARGPGGRRFACSLPAEHAEDPDLPDRHEAWADGQLLDVWGGLQ